MILVNDMNRSGKRQANRHRNTKSINPDNKVIGPFDGREALPQRLFRAVKQRFAVSLVFRSVITIITRELATNS